MWASSLAAQAAALEPPSAAASLAASALWENQQSVGWNGGVVLPQPQHTSLSQRGSLDAMPWAGPPEPVNPQHLTAAAKIYVQGLPQSLQHPVAVAGLFSPFGDVLDVKLYAAEVRLSGGSAVVRMRGSVQAAAAIAALNGAIPDGGWQQLTVRAAETAEQRSSRITAISGRQSGGAMGPGLAPPSPGMPPTGAAVSCALPPAGPGGAVSAALRRVQSSRGAGGSQGSMHCYTGGVVGARHSADCSSDWVRDNSLSSQRSSMEVGGRHAAATVFNNRCSSDSGSGGEGSGSEELATGEAGASGGGAAGGAGVAASGGGGGGPSSVEAQRMLLEAVLALVGQVEVGQISVAAMRAALENALAAAKSGAEDPPHQANNDAGRVSGSASAVGPWRQAS